MSLRSSLTKLVASLSPLRLTFAGVVAVGALVATSAANGCSDDGLAATCDDAGLNCMICDGYGCRPAGTTGSGGLGGSTASSSGTGGKMGTGGTGGTAPCNPKEATCACAGPTDCADGKQCIGGLCINGCNFTYECGSGNVCDNGACVPGCDATHPCAAGFTCTSGACQLDPTKPQCSATAPCPSGEICDANGLCTTHCTSTTQCATGQICDGSSQTCVSDPSTKPLCDAAKPCPSSETCLADGFCHYPCTSESQCLLIDARFVGCNGGFCQTQEEVSPECTLSMPCPSGKSCISNVCK
jgi:hypothetical protein